MTLPSNYFLYATDLIHTVQLGFGKSRSNAATQTLDLQANIASTERGFAGAGRSTHGLALMFRESCAAFGRRIHQMIAAHGATPCVVRVRAGVTTQAE
jgi:hypothetical protein